MRTFTLRIEQESQAFLRRALVSLPPGVDIGGTFCDDSSLRGVVDAWRWGNRWLPKESEKTSALSDVALSGIEVSGYGLEAFEKAP